MKKKSQMSFFEAKSKTKSDWTKPTSEKVERSGGGISVRPRLTHGGSLAIKKRKTTRPLNTKRPLHIVLRSDKARGRLSLLNHQGFINKCLTKFSAKFRVSVYEKAIVGNHIHLLIRGKTRKGIQDFFRTLAALIARHVTKARKGKPFGKYWGYLLFSRQLTSLKKDFENVKNYIEKNTLEALGLVKYERKGYTPNDAVT